MTLAEHLKQEAKAFILEAWTRCDGDPNETAKALGVSRAGLYLWMKRVGITEQRDNRRVPGLRKRLAGRITQPQ